MDDHDRQRTKKQTNERTDKEMCLYVRPSVRLFVCVLDEV